MRTFIILCLKMMLKPWQTSVEISMVEIYSLGPAAWRNKITGCFQSWLNHSPIISVSLMDRAERLSAANSRWMHSIYSFFLTKERSQFVFPVAYEQHWLTKYARPWLCLLLSLSHAISCSWAIVASGANEGSPGKNGVWGRSQAHSFQNSNTDVAI